MATANRNAQHGEDLAEALSQLKILGGIRKRLEVQVAAKSNPDFESLQQKLQMTARKIAERAGTTSTGTN